MKLVFPDTETTGLDRSSDEIIELAALRVDWPSWRVDGVYYRRFAPYGPVPPEAAAINGYTPEAWAGAERVTTADLLEFRDFVAGCRWIGSMPQFDFDFIERARMARGVDPFALASRRLWCVNSLASPLTFAGRVEKGGLDELCSVLGIGDPGEGAGFATAAGGRTAPHTAMGDALRCVMVLRRLLSAYLAHDVIAAILGEPAAARNIQHAYVRGNKTLDPVTREVFIGCLRCAHRESDHDARGSWHAVRVTTSGTPSGQHGACVAIAHLWRALGGESFPGFSTRGVSAEAPVTSANHVTEEELAEIDLDAANLADPTYGAANFARRQGAEERLARRAPRLAAALRAERSRREDAEMRLAELRAEIEAMRRGGSR